MDNLNRILDITLLNFADINVTVGQALGLVIPALVGALLVLWSTRRIVSALHRRDVHVNGSISIGGS